MARQLWITIPSYRASWQALPTTAYWIWFADPKGALQAKAAWSSQADSEGSSDLVRILARLFRDQWVSLSFFSRFSRKTDQLFVYID